MPPLICATVSLNWLEILTTETRRHRVKPLCLSVSVATLKKAERLAGLESREDVAQVLLSEMTAHEFAQHIAIIGRDGEIASLEELFLFEAGPLSVNFAAL